MDSKEKRPPEAVERGQAMKRIMYWMDHSDLGLLIQAGLLVGVIIASYVVLNVVV